MPRLLFVLLLDNFPHELQDVDGLGLVELFVLEVAHPFSARFIDVDLALHERIHVSEVRLVAGRLLELLRDHSDVVKREQIAQLNGHKQDLIVLDLNEDRDLVAFVDI